MRVLIAGAGMLMALAGCTPGPREQARLAQDTAAAQADLDRELAGLKPGATTDCIPNFRTNLSTTAYGPTILYRVSRGLVYRTDTAGGCEGVGHGDILVTRQYQGRACRGDIGVTIDNASRFQTGSCSLGAFTEYRSAR